MKGWEKVSDDHPKMVITGMTALGHRERIKKSASMCSGKKKVGMGELDKKED